MHSGQVKISIRGLDHVYRSNDVAALSDLSLDVHPGEFLCLLGPSGCGKSTLLYALAGTFKASRGEIRVDGKPLDGPSPDRLLMFQESALFPWLTVRQNLLFALGSRKLSRADREERTQHFLNVVKLSGFENALPHELSLGMRMRVSLARALAMEPSVLLMDEPFAPLDAETRGKMHELLQAIWMQSRKTVVFVTHNVRESIVLGDRIVLMAPRPGRIVRDLSVPLPRPRDPDDEKVVALSRRIREMLREAEEEHQNRQSLLRARTEEEDERTLPRPGAEVGILGAAPDPLGSGV